MSNTIHPTAIISGDVTLGAGNTVGPLVVITGPVTIGDDNWIGAGVVIGAPPEVRSVEHPRDTAQPAGNGVVIGDRNVIREYAQIHQGWKGQTQLGDDLFVMNQVYIAHDCHLANGVTLASSVLLAGHVNLGEGANLGLGTAVHQRVRIGAGTMIGMGAVVTRDILPFAKAYGNPARVHGINRIGMERGGIPTDAIDQVDAAFAEGNADLALLAANPALAAHFTGWL
ncbi:acyl-ACP--UDP-N- acetylglucosamine O-acyltransferase [Homoserinimonas sp. A447]